MLLLWFLALAIGLAKAVVDPKVLRPCFERYTNHRLVNLQPFHSEWRMGSEDRCLQFCSDTRSRCRSIVYDTVQHICHFFLEEGFDFTIPAAKMNYLKVVSSTCLDTFAWSSSEVNNIDSNARESTVAQTHPVTTSDRPVIPPSTVSVGVGTDVSSAPHGPTGVTTILSTATERTFTETIEAEDSQLQTAYRNNEIKSIDGVGGEEIRGQPSMEQLTNDTNKFISNDEGSHPRKENLSTKEVLPSTDGEGALKQKLKEKLELFKQKYPSRYVQYLLEKGDVSFPFLSSETATLKSESFKADTREKNKRTMFLAKRIPFSDDHLFSRKKDKTEIRRHQQKSLKLVQVEQKPSLLAKARSFLNIVNNKRSSTTNDDNKNERPVDNSAIVSDNPGCSFGQVPIWLVFENSVGSESIDSSFAKDWKACREVCPDEKCTSFTFFDDLQCMVNVEDDGVNLRKPPKGEYTARTDLKFCYPDNISPFHSCSDFVAFRDFTVKVKPKEQFFGLPLGYDGLKLCVELCVLSTQYPCKSAVFTILEGVCSLNEENSLSAPASFEQSTASDQLYFENGCSSQPELSPVDRSFMSIERMPLKKPTTKSSPVRTLEIKPIKLRKIVPESNRSNTPYMNN